MGAVVDLYPPPEPELDEEAPRATIVVDGDAYFGDPVEVEAIKPGDLVDVGFLTRVISVVAFRDGRICVHLTKRLAHGQLRLVQS